MGWKRRERFDLVVPPLLPLPWHMPGVGERGGREGEGEGEREEYELKYCTTRITCSSIFVGCIF